ncbi:MAG: hypothetical protein QW429_05625, partial [Thermoprotei archaeon]
MRARRLELLEANRLANSLFSVDTISKEYSLVEDYYDKTSDKAIVLRNRKTLEYRAIPMYNRLSENYRDIIEKKVWKYYRESLRNETKFLFLTLDASTQKYFSQADAHLKVQKQLNSLLTRIRKKYPEVKYVRVNEWQKNGLGYHVHILFAGINYLPREWIA